jgi:hypothetical protein
MGKRQHYIPKFYLSGFALEKAKPYLWIYEKGISGVKKASVNDIALEKEYYAYLKPDGQKDTDSFENYLAGKETLVAPILIKIQNFLKINEQEKAIMSEFISLMMTRIPKYKDEKLADRLDKSFDSIYKTITDPFIIYNENFKYVLYNNNTIRSVKSKISLDTIASLSKQLAPYIYKMMWEFLIANSDIKYITSDNPVYFCRPPYEKEPPFTFGLSNKNIEVTFPISKEIALLCSWKKDSQAFRKANNNSIRMVNRRAVIAAKRFVYSSTANEGIRKLIDKYNSNITIK